MEVSPLFPSISTAQLYPQTQPIGESPALAPIDNHVVDAQLIDSLSTTDGNTEDKFLPTYTGLAISAEEILKKLNEALGKYGQSVEQLKPEDATPEATSDRILKGIKGLFAAYKSQNPELSGAELVDGFIAEAKKGVQAGYDDAHETLKGIGAFSFEGLEDTISKTLTLVTDGLSSLRDELIKGEGLQAQTANITTGELLTQGKLYKVA